MAPAPTRVLFVCTGNVCRSPMAERLFVARAGSASAAGDVAVESAGTAALIGEAMDRSSADAIAELGADPGGHVARQLTEELIEGVDLVLTAEVAHRRWVLGRRPTAMGRTFALAEFARLVAAVDLSSVEGLAPEDRIRLVAAQRGRVPPAPGGGDDIVDPYRQEVAVARACASRIDAAVVALRDLFAGP